MARTALRGEIPIAVGTRGRTPMIVDTSALIAIALGEPETIRLLKRLHGAPTRRISIASVLEA